MTLVAGSYERFLFGYSCTAPSEGAPAALIRRFTHAAHKGVVKCLAAAGQYLASGGADDLIHLYDLKSDKDLGFLMNPGDGAITALEFFVPDGAYNPTHLLSGSADGSVSVWSVGGGWECMKTMRGHKKEVNAISVHSTGALALSCSRDGTLRMWDLVKGRATWATKLEAEAESVAFGPSGSMYALLCGAHVTLHAVGGTQGLVGELPHPRRALCMAFSPDGAFLLTGAEDGALRVWSTKASEEVLCVPRAHATRIRGLALPHAPIPLPAGASAGLPPLVATASSDGAIKLWDLSGARLAPQDAAAPAPQGASCLAEAATSARLTTLCALDPPALMAQRLKQCAGRQQAAGGVGAGPRLKQGPAPARAERAVPGKAKRKLAPQGEGASAGAGTADGLERRLPAKEPALQRGQTQGGLQEKHTKHAWLVKKAASIEASGAAHEGGGAAGGASGAGRRAGKTGPAAQQPEGFAGDGVVDFMAAKDWQKAKQKRKKKQKQQG